MSESPIYYSLDEQADQLLICSIGNTTILSWRMMLNPSVLKQRKGYEFVDKPILWRGMFVLLLLFIFLYVYQYSECKRMKTEYNCYDSLMIDWM